MVPNYPKEIIDKFGAWVDDDPDALEWLIAFKHKELIMLREAVFGDSKAIQALLTTKQFILAAFANAVWDDTTALKILLMKKAFHWAAVASIINGDDKAQVWLMKNGLEYYIPLAFKIQEQIRRNGDRNSMGINFSVKKKKNENTR